MALLADLVNAVSDFVGTVDSNGGIMFLNPAARRMLEIPPDEDIRGQNVLQYNERPSLEIQQELDRSLRATKQEWTGTSVFLSRSGKRIPVSQVMVAHQTDGNRYWSTIARDISAQLKVEEELRWAAEHDQLTGLLNRSAFRKAVAPHVEHSQVLLVLDLENFKQVNDTYGHHVGDQVLQRAAWVLQDTVAELGIVARLGGDEFAATIFAHGDQQPDEIIDRLERELHRHLTLFGVEVRIGTTKLDPTNDSLDLALQMADLDLSTRKLQRSSATVTERGEHSRNFRPRNRSSHHRR